MITFWVLTVCAALTYVHAVPNRVRSSSRPPGVVRFCGSRGVHELAQRYVVGGPEVGGEFSEGTEGATKPSWPGDVFRKDSAQRWLMHSRHRELHQQMPGRGV